MDKRYQVIISSTFRDLVQERQEVLKAVLAIDHMPAGMELFPASDDAAWQLSRDVIDGSDYYVVIIGGPLRLTGRHRHRIHREGIRLCREPKEARHPSAAQES